MEEILSVFIQEAREQLSEMEAGLMRMEQGDHDPETLNGVFRAAHTIKGGSGVVELTLIEKFTHVVENALDKLRNNEIAVSSELISAVLNCCDHLNALLDLAESEQSAADPALQAKGETLANTLRGFLGGAVASSPAASAPAEAAAEVETDGGGKTMNDCWHISVRFGRDVL
ncbi:MAG: Hpt domain-containing protein, partial [Sterolibacterium sp.]